MWIQVRTIDGSQTRTIEDVSRKATIEELRERVWALFDVRPECQRLFYRGKQVRRAHRTPREARGEGYRAPLERVGWTGPRAWSAARVESTWLPFGWAAREAQSAGPGPAEGAQRGPYQPQSASAAGRVRGGGTQSAETSASPPFSMGQYSPPECLGSLASRARRGRRPWRRGGQRALAAMPQCWWGGPTAPAPGRADPANGSHCFRGSSALPASE